MATPNPNPNPNDENLPPALPADNVPDPEAERLRSELARATASNEDLKRKLASRPTPVYTGTESRPAPTPQDLQRQFFERPIESAAAIAQTAVTAALEQENNSSFETIKALARSQARQGREELFDRYASEIDALMEQAPPQFQKNIHVWKNAANNVFGQHVDEIRPSSKESGNRSPAVILSRSADGPAPPSPPTARVASPGASLTQEEREVAQALAPHVGWDHGEAEERYAHGKAVMEGQGDGRATRPSSWDPVVTFNNRFGRRNKDVKGDK